MLPVFSHLNLCLVGMANYLVTLVSLSRFFRTLQSPFSPFGRSPTAFSTMGLNVCWEELNGLPGATKAFGPAVQTVWQNSVNALVRSTKAFTQTD